MSYHLSAAFVTETFADIISTSSRFVRLPFRTTSIHPMSAQQAIERPRGFWRFGEISFCAARLFEPSPLLKKRGFQCGRIQLPNIRLHRSGFLCSTCDAVRAKTGACGSSELFAAAARFSPHPNAFRAKSACRPANPVVVESALCFSHHIPPQSPSPRHYDSHQHQNQNQNQNQHHSRWRCRQSHHWRCHWRCCTH